MTLPPCHLLGVNLEFLFPSTGPRSQRWNRVCCCWASDCNVLWKAKYAREHSDWGVGTWPDRHSELLRNKGGSSPVLSGGKRAARNLNVSGSRLNLFALEIGALSFCCFDLRPGWWWWGSRLLFWVCTWPGCAGSSLSFLDGILQKLGRALEVQPGSLGFPHVMGSCETSPVSRVCLCFALAGRSHQYHKGLSHVWFNRLFGSMLDVEKCMRCFNFLPKLAFGVRVGILFYNFINTHFHRLAS